MKLTIQEVAKAVHALEVTTVDKEMTLTGAEFDSRKITEGDLFVPLKGARDGHEFVNAAIANGAVATLWAKDNGAIPKDFSAIIVEDVLVAFQQLAKYFLEKIRPTVVGITGSNGKTTTKDMTAAVLSASFKTYKTQGNHNNEIGLPYTILSMPEDTEKLVLEMGMDHEGDLHLLSTLAQPEIAAITLIGESHLEYFGTREKIAQGKMEIVDGLKEDGILIVPADEPLLVPLTEKLHQEVVRFGLEKSADVYATIKKEAKGHVDFTLSFLEGEFRIPVPGAYNVRNALVAALIAKRLGMSDEKIREALATVELTKNRTQWLKNSKGVEILSDVYNANPTAMGLVLDSFSKMPTKGRRVAVLGDMLELGDKSGSLHRSMALHLFPDEIERVYLYGSEMLKLTEVIKDMYPVGTLRYYNKTEKLDEKNELIKDLKEELKPEDMVLLKASNGMGLSEVVLALMEK
ncbi:MAG: UDP-N-acetylmuramoyl-tripeptide--D-alanyl-D-alanine ligase [Lactobacillales bacterium]|jgi:UDP-N-acetylmuramoyl-tripeptide--D-alanyl-D-alanine ligase|nr:UDP-N-acetylmuramoyl-tripeptide--D-alanyl-D-alanine ligase [Lactobacillales bacterium]